MRRLLLLGLVLAAGCDRGGTGAANGAAARGGTPFDGERALGYVRTQLEFGPRIPGTEGHRKTGDWLVAELRQRADTVIEQRFTHVTGRGDTLPMRNVLARFRPELERRVLYLAHWDTRPVADSELMPEARKQPVPGANDGGSGVAILLGVADVLAAEPPGVGVDLLFVDGEDYGDFGDWGSTAGPVDVLIGSRHFARNLPDAGYQPLFGVLFDMVGDADLRILQEGHSLERAPEVVARVWQTAAELGYGAVFQNRATDPITDDHVPLLDAGLRVIDVIDLEYPPHHTTRDTLDKVSARSLKMVGDVAVALIRGVE